MALTINTRDELTCLKAELVQIQKIELRKLTTHELRMIDLISAVLVEDEN